MQATTATCFTSSKQLQVERTTLNLKHCLHVHCCSLVNILAPLLGTNEGCHYSYDEIPTRCGQAGIIVIELKIQMRTYRLYLLCATPEKVSTLCLLL